jgi:hypothetical protein
MPPAPTRRRANASPNPADDPTFRRALHRHVEQLAGTVTYAEPDAHRPRGYDKRQYRERIAAPSTASTTATP